MPITQYTTGCDTSNHPMIISGLISTAPDVEHSVNGSYKFHALRGKKPNERRIHKNNWSLSIVGSDKHPYVRWFDDIGDIHQWLDCYKYNDLTISDIKDQFIDAV